MSDLSDNIYLKTISLQISEIKIQDSQHIIIGNIASSNFHLHKNSVSGGGVHICVHTRAHSGTVL